MPIYTVRDVLSVNCTRKQERGARERGIQREDERERGRGSERCSITLSNLLPVSLAQASPNFTLLSLRFSLALLPFAPWSQCGTSWCTYTHKHTRIHTHAHAYIHIHTQTHAYTRIHTHAGFFCFFFMAFFLPQRRCRMRSGNEMWMPAWTSCTSGDVSSIRYSSTEKERKRQRARIDWQIHRKGLVMQWEWGEHEVLFVSIFIFFMNYV